MAYSSNGNKKQTLELFVETISVTLHFTERVAISLSLACVVACLKARGEELSATFKVLSLGGFRQQDCWKYDEADHQQCQGLVCHFLMGSFFKRI